MEDIAKNNVPEEFKDISPISDVEFHKEMSELVKKPGFKLAIEHILPSLDFNQFSEQLLKFYSKNEFQRKMMMPFLEQLASKTSAGISGAGISNVDKDIPYTYVTNHRDIVLDACFLNLLLLKSGRNTTEVAIGNNLLIFEWIEMLVKLNKSFIVKRNLKMHQALEAAIQLSKYIHYTISKKKESIWIAQRQGRAKDSNDRTQDALVKMLAIGGEGSVIDRLKELNILPVSLSYEYDPNDYLKAREFLLKKKDPNFKKSKQDDLESMQVGLTRYKGRIHFEFASCINPELDKLPSDMPKADVYRHVCELIDHDIFKHYYIFPTNFIAYDLLHKEVKFADRYTPEEVEKFKNYLRGQLSKVDIDNLTEEDNEYLMEMMLKMYSNPLVNKLSVTKKV